MPEFAQGLVLEVPNRDQFKKYVQNNAHDPAVQFESWGANSVPEALVVVDYRHHDENPYYKCLDKHVNGRVSTTYWDEGLIRDMINDDVLNKTDNYDVNFVEENR